MTWLVGRGGGGGTRCRDLTARWCNFVGLFCAFTTISLGFETLNVPILRIILLNGVLKTLRAAIAFIMPIPKQVSEAAAMMMIWEDDTAGMNALALTQAFQRWHFDVKTVVLPVNPSVKGSGSQSAFGEYKSWVEEHDKPEKTLVFCYFGHGDIKDGRLRGSK